MKKVCKKCTGIWSNKSLNKLIKGSEDALEVYRKLDSIGIDRKDIIKEQIKWISYLKSIMR